MAHRSTETTDMMTEGTLHWVRPGLGPKPGDKYSVRTLEFVYVLNEGIVYEGTHFPIFLFPPSYMFFLANFFSKLESMTLI